MSNTLDPGPEFNASTADAQRDGPIRLDHFDQLTTDPYTITESEERFRYFQMLAANAAPTSAIEKRDEQPMSKLASYMTLSPTEQLPNETVPLNAKHWSRDRPLPSPSINGMLPLIDFKEKPNADAKKFESAAVVPQNHRQADTTGRTEVHRESVDTPMALLGDVVGSRDNSAESSNQAGARDIHPAKFGRKRAAPNWALPGFKAFSSNLPKTSYLTREMEAERDSFRSSRQYMNRLPLENMPADRANPSEMLISYDLAGGREAYREAIRSSRENRNRLFYEKFSQQKDKLNVASKPSSHHSPDLAIEEPNRQPLPQTLVLRPTQEQSRVASATLPDHQHQTLGADSETQLGKMPPLQPIASNVQPPSEAALLDYRVQLQKLEHQAYLHGFGKWHQGSNRSNNSLSDEELGMIHPFTRNLATRESSAEPLNLQEELTMPNKLHMAQKEPQKINVTEDRRELQNAMDIDGNVSSLDAHSSQKKAPVDGSYLAEEERKVLDHVRGSMSTNLPFTKVPDLSSMNRGGNLEPAGRSLNMNNHMEDLQKLNDHPMLRDRVTSCVGTVRPIGIPLNDGFLQGPALEASTPSMAQAHKATQTCPGQKTDLYKEQDAIMQRQSVRARSWNTASMEASRIAEERAKVFRARFSGEPRQTCNGTSTEAMSIPSTAIDTIASRIPVRESTIMPPLFKCPPSRPKSEKADINFSRSTPSTPATCEHPVVSKMQSSGAQTAPSVSLGQHSEVTNRDPRITNDQVKPAKDTPNELNMAQNRKDQRGQDTGKSSELPGMFQNIIHGTNSQATNDTLIAEDYAESTAKPVVSNKLQLSEEKRDQMIKEGPRSLRDFQRAVGSTESQKDLLATSHPSFTRDNSSNSAEKKSTESKNLRSVTEKAEKDEKRRLRELLRTLYVDLELQSQKRSEAEKGIGPLELAENLAGSTSNWHSFNHMEQSQKYHQLPYNRYMPHESKPQTINEARAVKAEFYASEKDAVLNKPSYIVEREGERMGYRDYDLEKIVCESSLRRPEYKGAIINLPTTDSTSSKIQSWVEPRAVKRENLMSEFWSQPRKMTASKGLDSPDCDIKSRSGSSPMAARPALYNVPSPPSTPKADLRSDIGGPDIDNWRMLVDFESKAPSATALVAAKGKLTFSKEPILRSAPIEHEDTKSTSLPVFTRDVAYNPFAAEKVTTPSANLRTTFPSPNGISISITGDTEARSADASTDVFVARDEDEDDEKGDLDDWTVLGSDHSSSRDSSVESKEALEAAPSEASDPSSMDVEVGDDRSEVNEVEWIIC